MNGPTTLDVLGALSTGFAYLKPNANMDEFVIYYYGLARFFNTFVVKFTNEAPFGHPELTEVIGVLKNVAIAASDVLERLLKVW